MPLQTEGHPACARFFSCSPVLDTRATCSSSGGVTFTITITIPVHGLTWSHITTLTMLLQPILDGRKATKRCNSGQQKLTASQRQKPKRTTSHGGRTPGSSSSSENFQPNAATSFTPDSDSPLNPDRERERCVDCRAPRQTFVNEAVSNPQLYNCQWSNQTGPTLWVKRVNNITQITHRTQATRTHSSHDAKLSLF